MPHLRRQRRQWRVQYSRLLDLPPEIRNQIYAAALVSPLPIGLCPATYIHAPEDIEKDQAMQKRSSAFQMTNDAQAINHRNRPPKLSFRQQSSLLYVRRCLAVGLLATCCQIFTEAASYFWGENVWRFSDDQEWEVLLRFLLTIGPTAKSMIRKLEVLASDRKLDDVFSRDVHWYFKNHPKLHMVKLYHDDSRHETVWGMLASEKWLPQLDLIVPAGYKLRPGYWGSSWYWNWDEFQMRCNVKTRIVVESGADLYNRKTISQEEGWDIIALPGSQLCETLGEE